MKTIEFNQMENIQGGFFGGLCLGLGGAAVVAEGAIIFGLVSAVPGLNVLAWAAGAACVLTTIE